MIGDQPPAVREAAEQIATIVDKPDPVQWLCCCGAVRDGSHDHNSCGPPIPEAGTDGADQLNDLRALCPVVIRDYERLSAEVARLRFQKTESIGFLSGCLTDSESLAAERGRLLAREMNKSGEIEREVIRLRGLVGELIEAGHRLAGYLDSFFASHMRECGRFECLKRWDAVAARAAEAGGQS